MAANSRIFSRPAAANRAWLAERLRDETVGGLLLLAAAGIAIFWANSAWRDSYFALVDTQLGPADLHLRLTVGKWAADALLALFFFVVGLELKHELVLGSLSQPARAALPIAAALGGMVLPALIYLAVNAMQPTGAPVGWGVPMATDIAFALAVLAVVGRGLPVALRAFLLTLAVVDDLGAIIVIALFYSGAVALNWLLVAVGCFAAYAYAQRRRWHSAWLYLPLAAVAWWAVHQSGVHATVAGVVLGLLTRVRADAGEPEAPAERLQHLLHPYSAGLAVPVFAFTAAGVSLAGIDLAEVATHPVAAGIFLGLTLGKPLGIVGTAWLVARFTRAELDQSVRWSDVAAAGLLAGVGFTVSLLIAELAFAGSELHAEAKLGIVTASVTAAFAAALLMSALGRRRQRTLQE